MWQRRPPYPARRNNRASIRASSRNTITPLDMETARPVRWVCRLAARCLVVASLAEAAAEVETVQVVPETEAAETGD